eukprot:scaffold4079_cov211-Alexandrium_tamarense.AAC.18
MLTGVNYGEMYLRKNETASTEGGEELAEQRIITLTSPSNKHSIFDLDFSMYKAKFNWRGESSA